MKHRYIAKVYLEDGQMLENSGDNLEELTSWVSGQAEASFGDIKGEIFDTHLHKIVKTIQCTPPE